MRPFDFDAVFDIWRHALALFGFTALYYVNRHNEYEIYITCGERRASCTISTDGLGPFSDEENLERAIVDLVCRLQMGMIKDRNLSIKNLGPSGRV